MSDVVIIDSGVANLASVASGLRGLGATFEITRDPETVRSASRVVLPGVGAFGAGMAAVRANGLDEVVRDLRAADRPMLAICLGMQLLGQGSTEEPGLSGIGIVPGVFQALPSGVRVPHLGWNGVVAPKDAEVLSSGDAAFANSYCLTEAPAGWEAAWTTHGVRFVSALAQGRLLACQFHPELSGRYGMDLLDRWLRDAPPDPGATATLRGDSVAHRIVPCLDVKHGRVVKGVKFQNLRDAGDPAAQSALYEAQGADEIVILDIAASPEARDTQAETVRAVRAGLHIPLTVGGGVRSVEDARNLLAAGADKVSVNTAAVHDPALLTAMAGAFGRQCVVLAIDARRVEDRWEVLIMGGRDSAGIDAIAWAREGVARGAGEILLTSWDRDGTRAGADVALLAAVSQAVPVPVIASGGIGTREHVAEAFTAGADAVLAASVFHDGDDTVGGIKEYLAGEGVTVRR